jgi:hypothetical protein
MKAATALVVLSLLAAIALAAQPVLVSASPKISALVVLGKGIAANPSDAMDFMIAKVGIGKVRYNVTESSEIIGVLKLDEESYRLKNIVIEEGHATGSIYKNSSEVGSFDVSSVMKGDTEVWAGTMILDGKTYHIYIIEGVRPVKASELKERVVEYCNNYEDANCADRLRNYCQDNPDDARCRALFRAWCLKEDNMDDTRCRLEFREWCNEHPENAHCIPFALNRSMNYCEENPDSSLCEKIATAVANICEGNPNNTGCATVKQIIAAKPRLLQNVQVLRQRISRLQVNVQAISAVTSADVGGGE